ncbi:hypothetical protein [Rhizobium ruizarguesonis]|uniref:hypothetical protein n=1 Tax=Rhizobium ruizarguesonis TaxID=2081791 RepID=UPI0010303C2D|nr:hypothetical protein [Rhizobium ruizarguesonis]NKJ73504.1 hypothetical protein [Rhizobium leguminosarum bv. viciae]MBC2803506.1 hypothetical protein [Rhizobium ruizarguesonis]NKQ71671.1 hypothetical protein [Rhizobium ruizarguesonis]NKQ79246.1 hypothetical protein [Rhizobium ruizarguesonis]TAU48056.1 hypothetical protein ELI42_08455 [Rhizobium ruizarguesonis]
MFVSFREAADLSLQIALVLALTASGMAVASSAVGGEKAGISALDVSRPSLWTAAPMRVDPTTQAYLRADAPAALELADGADDLCHDLIGLRLSCDLIVTSGTAAF